METFFKKKNQFINQHNNNKKDAEKPLLFIDMTTKNKWLPIKHIFEKYISKITIIWQKKQNTKM